MPAASAYSRPVWDSLLPDEWARAPIEFWERDRLTALVFFIVNFFFGTVGIWLPLVNAIFGTKPFLKELSDLFDSGALYFYSIAFLAAIAGTTFTSLVRDQKQHTRSVKTVLAGCSGVSIFLCTVFLQVQLGLRNTEHVDNWIACINYTAQFLFSALAVLVAVYVHSIIFNEETGSPKTDIDRGAEQILEQSQATGATVSQKDFVS